MRGLDPTDLSSSSQIHMALLANVVAGFILWLNPRPAALFIYTFRGCFDVMLSCIGKLWKMKDTWVSFSELSFTSMALFSELFVFVTCVSPSELASLLQYFLKNILRVYRSWIKCIRQRAKEIAERPSKLEKVFILKQRKPSRSHTQNFPISPKPYRILLVEVDKFSASTSGLTFYHFVLCLSYVSCTITAFCHHFSVMVDLYVNWCIAHHCFKV